LRRPAEIAEARPGGIPATAGKVGILPLCVPHANSRLSSRQGASSASRLRAGSRSVRSPTRVRGSTGKRDPRRSIVLPEPADVLVPEIRERAARRAVSRCSRRCSRTPHQALMRGWFPHATGSMGAPWRTRRISSQGTSPGRRRLVTGGCDTRWTSLPARRPPKHTPPQSDLSRKARKPACGGAACSPARGEAEFVHRRRGEASRTVGMIAPGISSDVVIFVDLGYGRTVSPSTSPLLGDQAN
jgi:hypothetical protein